MNNLYDDSKYTDTISTLKKQLKNLRSKYGEDNKKFAFNKVIEDYWDYDKEDRQKAIAISAEYAKKRNRKK